MKVPLAQRRHPPRYLKGLFENVDKDSEYCRTYQAIYSYPEGHEPDKSITYVLAGPRFLQS